MKAPLSLLLGTAMALGACANSGAGYSPVLDGAPTPAYHADLRACQTLARDQRQLDHETMGAALLGAGLGAVLGDADAGGDALGGAIAGAVAGGAASAVDVSDRREAMVIQCLRGRGHRVVG
ncbi:glycine zipper family protein [Rhodobacter sp. NTK016B]|uniref:glycine zipper family protein n=1 Tax=Rhodobacter sp. NTK016B TaxID=2759676 RepID=UPI001A8E1D97|nr:glycine zipper family protein [Rhodobacter sp. NTK016B]MBN8291120.1 glycine zipper family protein [Rhodobacter sp. NTK016B]